MRKAILLATVAGLLLAAPLYALPEPIFYEPLDTLKPVQPNTTLMNPTELGEGKIGAAVLLERRTLNLLKAPGTESKDAWMLLNGASFNDSVLKLPASGEARQTVSSLSPDKIYCLSVYARSSSAQSAKISLGWDGSVPDNRQEFTVGRDWKRVWVSGETVEGSATVIMTAVEGAVEIERPQFEMGGSVPTSYITGDMRGVSGLVWRPTEGEFDPTRGSISFWMKADWVGETLSSSVMLFRSFHEYKEEWKEMPSVITLNVWALDPDARDWRYAINLGIVDKKLKSHALSVPLQHLKKGWNHVALTWDFSDPKGGRATLYINGEQVGALNNLVTSGMEPASEVAFGQGIGGYLDGWLDEARVYSTELSAEDVKTLAEGKE